MFIGFKTFPLPAPGLFFNLVKHVSDSVWYLFNKVYAEARILKIVTVGVFKCAILCDY